MGLTRITSDGITDGAVVNADINASAAIDVSKLSGVLPLAGGTLIGNLAITREQPIISFNDSTDNPDYYIGNIDGSFRIRDTTNSSNRLVVNSDGHVDVLGNLDVGAGIDVTGDINATGNLNCSDITLTDAHPVITFTDTDNNPDFRIKGNSGAIEIEDITNNRASLTVYNDNHIDIHGNLDVGAGLDVTGNITATGTISSGNINITSVAPIITLTDTNANDDFEIKVNGGLFEINDITNSANRFIINSDGTVDILGNLDVGAGIDVTGNITVTGTVDGRDLASDGAFVDSLYGGSNGTIKSNVVLNNGVTATTQSASDNSTKVATTAYTDTAISNLVDSSPSALNTLNELAAALGDDANFSTTVTNSIATKLPLAGGTLTGKLTIDTNTSNMLELKPTNSSPWVISIDRDDLDASRVFAHNPAGTVAWIFEHNPVFYNSGGYNRLLSTADEGSGNGLDADTLDGVQGSSFLRSDANNSASGKISFSGGDSAIGISANSDIRFASGNWTGESMKIQGHNNQLYVQGGSSGIVLRGSDGGNIAVFENTAIQFVDPITASADVMFNGGGGAATIAANSDIRLVNGNWTGNSYGKIQHHNNFLYISGGTSGIIFREDNSNRWRIDGDGHFEPGLSGQYNIGATDKRVNNIYTNDLHLSNEGSSNDVDGTWGSYTIQEGAEDLFLINKRSGKKYKFNLTEV